MENQDKPWFLLQVYKINETTQKESLKSEANVRRSLIGETNELGIWELGFDWGNLRRVRLSA